MTDLAPDLDALLARMAALPAAVALPDLVEALGLAVAEAEALIERAVDLKLVVVWSPPADSGLDVCLVLSTAATGRLGVELVDDFGRLTWEPIGRRSRASRPIAADEEPLYVGGASSMKLRDLTGPEIAAVEGELAERLIASAEKGLVRAKLAADVLPPPVLIGSTSRWDGPAPDGIACQVCRGATLRGRELCLACGRWALDALLPRVFRPIPPAKVKTKAAKRSTRKERRAAVAKAAV